MLLGILSGLLVFVGLLMLVANLLYVGYMWEKRGEFPLPWCTEFCEVDYFFYSILSSMIIIVTFMIPPLNLVIVPIIVSGILGIMSMIGIVRLGQRLAHIQFKVETKKEDE